MKDVKFVMIGLARAYNLRQALAAPQFEELNIWTGLILEWNKEVTPDKVDVS